MKSVLISIRPQWVEKIASGQKTIEVRKSAPKEVPFKAYIYETQGKTETPWIDEDGHFVYKGRGQVIGEFICDGIAEFEGEFHDDGSTEELRRVWYDEDDGERDAELFAENGEQNYLCTSSCLTWGELKKYIGIGYHTFYGWHISDLKIYDKPRELREFYAVCKYINADKSCHFRKVMCPYQQFDYNEDGSINIVECSRVIIRPPQSWMYIEGLREE